jgi:hypothetical protein
MACDDLPETWGSHVLASAAGYAVVEEEQPAASTNSTRSAANRTRILIMGDSWGTVSPATEYFEKELNQHGCPLDGFTNIAVGGTTAKQWAGIFKLGEVRRQAKDHDIIWITLMGNDALNECPSCASAGKSAAECADELYASVSASMKTIVEAIHEANPAAKVVGFGYDTMFGGLGCSLIQKQIFPQCWHNSTVHNPVRCFNDQFLRIQQKWDDLASTYDFVDSINILGVTQAAGGDKAASVGHPDLEKNGPREYWPDTLGCIHPARPAGAMVVMDEFYRQYWSKALGC